MRVGIFYLSHHFHDELASQQQALVLPNGGRVWIRVEEHEGDLESAMQAAKAYDDDEWMMNTHELPEQK